MMITKTSFATLVVLACLALPAQAALLQFEDNFESYANTAAMTSTWTVISNTLDTTYSAILVNSVGLGEGGSNRLSQFTGNGNAVGDKGGIETTIAVVSGVLHELTFYHREIGSGTTLTTSLTNSDFVSSDYNPSGSWLQETISFTPSSSSVTLRFQETQDNSFSNAIQIDSIQLNSLPVPEPATATLSVIGIFLFGRSLRRKRRNAQK